MCPGSVNPETMDTDRSVPFSPVGVAWRSIANASALGGGLGRVGDHVVWVKVIHAAFPQFSVSTRTTAMQSPSHEHVGVLL